MRALLLTGLLIAGSFFAFSQDSTRKVPATRTTKSIKIDGELNDEAWKLAPLVTDLVEQRPVFGRKETQSTRSELYILYDDVAVYFGGILYESGRDSLSTELTGRDGVGVNDFIGIIFDTYQDKINGLGFYVTPLGEQFDVKYAIGNEDGSWNAVYDSEAKITNQGWTFEMKIPYSAIRFSKEKKQDWNIQIIRRRAKSGQQRTWSPVDPTKFGFMNQAGTMTGLEDIKPPIRLSFSPYLSTYLAHNPEAPGKKTQTTLNGGMDVKYGISDGFTMDMTLVPDFGQVQSDNQVLNLSPFEVRYNENRSFFTEGTELFNKGNLFYSRRIGGVPIHSGDVYNRILSNETVVKNPGETKLINATKISGRTKDKLGIGFFNAITKPQYATIENDSKQQYKIETNPLTNYNVFVLDQAMKNNSAVSIINTNVWRSGNDYDANVTAVLWDLYDKNVDWNVWGQVSHSRLIGADSAGKTIPGYHYNVFLGKFKGRFNFDVHRFFADEKYDQRDMGYFTNNNYVTHGFYAGYKWVKPRSFYNNIYMNLNGNYSELYKPSRFQYVRINFNVNSQLKSLWQVGFVADARPENQDFFEPRIWGKMVKLPGSRMVGVFTSSNRAKKYSASAEFYYRRGPKYDYDAFQFELGNTYRFSNQFSVSLSTFTEMGNNYLGFAYLTYDPVTGEEENSVFGLRDQRTVENVFNARYNFNNKMGLNFRLRHYWSQVKYSQYFNLLDDGYISSTPTDVNANNNVNFWNIDMIYTWQFAPGSFINIGWKNSADDFDQNVKEKYFSNFSNTVTAQSQNNFSIKVIYFLDYLNLKKRKTT